MLAIVIPYYKLTFFDETLDSLSKQTDKRFKVYVGDDASPEDPSILIDQYKSQMNMMYHRFNENYGSVALSKQWDRCIALTHEEPWIMILGDDDILTPNVVQDFYSYVEEDLERKYALIRFASRFINALGTRLEGFDDYFHPKEEKAEDAFFRKWIGETRSSLSEYVFARDSYTQFGFQNYPLAWHTDDFAWLKFVNKKPILTINTSLVHVRVSDLSITGTFENEAVKNEAKRMFLRNVIFDTKLNFNTSQKNEILFAYGEVIKVQNKIEFIEVLKIFFQFISSFSFYNGMRFLRRMIRAKQNK